MFITKQALSRRTVLRGLGATFALPMLDAMVPAMTPIVRTAAAPTRRFGAVFVPINTRLAPPDRVPPEEVGTGHDRPFPETFVGQLLAPFRPALWR